MKKGFLFIAAIAAFFAACQKDEHRSMRELGIARGSWKIKTRDTFYTASPDQVQYDTLNRLQRATRYRFLASGDIARMTTFQLDTFQVEDSIISGKWILSEADTRLTITDSSLAGKHYFVSYSDSLMKLVRVEALDDTDSTAVTTVLRRQ